jgi:uncharacterized protein (TIGR00255 family)
MIPIYKDYMINSMTGYGKGTAGNKKLTVEVELRSVNNRFLDISMKTPSSLQSKEYEIRELLKSKIKRGKLTVSIQLKKNGGSENDGLQVDKEKVKEFINILKQLKKTARLTEKIKLEHLLLNKDLYTYNTVEMADDEYSVVREALVAAADSLMLMKKNEGGELARDLKKRLTSIEEKLEAIELDAVKNNKEHFDKLKERIKLLFEDISAHPERLEMELALIVEKSDITEECVRLRSHLKFCMDSIDNEEDPGRKLNFLCQEMNREANTISAKSLTTLITHNTVLIKEEIEKIREQIQNIE